MAFTHEDPELVKAVGMLEELVNSTIAESAKAKQENFTTSFAGQLALVAKTLRECNMPVETINMCLAARCGLPMQKIDPKSPCFVWVEDEPVAQQ